MVETLLQSGRRTERLWNRAGGYTEFDYWWLVEQLLYALWVEEPLA